MEALIAGLIAAGLGVGIWFISRRRGKPNREPETIPPPSVPEPEPEPVLYTVLHDGRIVTHDTEIVLAKGDEHA